MRKRADGANNCLINFIFYIREKILSHDKCRRKALDDDDFKASTHRKELEIKFVMLIRKRYFETTILKILIRCIIINE